MPLRTSIQTQSAGASAAFCATGCNGRFAPLPRSASTSHRYMINPPLIPELRVHLGVEFLGLQLLGSGRNKQRQLVNAVSFTLMRDRHESAQNARSRF